MLGYLPNFLTSATRIYQDQCKDKRRVKISNNLATILLIIPFVLPLATKSFIQNMFEGLREHQGANLLLKDTLHCEIR